MFDQYLVAEDDDGREYGRSASLINGMIDKLDGVAVAEPGTMIDDLNNTFADAPATATPEALLRNAMDHSLRNLHYVGAVVAKPGTQVSVPGLMSCIRIALLGTSHLCYVVSGLDTATATERMGGLYKLEINSAAKFVNQIDSLSPACHGLPGLCPEPNSAIRQLASYANPHPPAPRLTESDLLANMKDNILPPLLAKLSVDSSTGTLLIDHLFNTTSGAAHGYAWIDLAGVSAHFVGQFSVTTMMANVVFNDYLHALGQHPADE